MHDMHVLPQGPHACKQPIHKYWGKTYCVKQENGRKCVEWLGADTDEFIVPHGCSIPDTIDQFCHPIKAYE